MIDTDLYEYLSDQDTITAIVADRIFPNCITESAVFPALTIQLAGTDRQDTLLHPCGIVDFVYQIDSYSLNHLEVCQLAEAVRLKLQGYIGAMGASEILYVQLITDESRAEPPIDGSDNWIYRKFQKYKIKCREEIPSYGG